MRVYVETDMTVCHGYHVVTLKAGQTVEGPLAVYLAESGCEVTIEHDDRPDPAVEQPAETGNPGPDGPPEDGNQDPAEFPLSAKVSQHSGTEASGSDPDADEPA